jgi:peptide/nickel transport system substrate-binding protein
MFAWVSSPETDPTQTYHSKSIPSEKNGWSGTNYPGWRNAKVDAAIESLNKSFDANERKEQIKTILAEYTRELPVLPLFYRANVTVFPKTLTGVKPTPHVYSETFAIEHWAFSGDQLSKN